MRTESSHRVKTGKQRGSAVVGTRIERTIEMLTQSLATGTESYILMGPRVLRIRIAKCAYVAMKANSIPRRPPRMCVAACSGPTRKP